MVAMAPLGDTAVEVPSQPPAVPCHRSVLPSRAAAAQGQLWSERSVLQRVSSCDQQQNLPLCLDLALRLHHPISCCGTEVLSNCAEASGSCNKELFSAAFWHLRLSLWSCRGLAWMIHF